MTPGQQALHEAMRLEQARIYGQLTERAEPAVREVSLEAAITYWHRHGNSVASIAFRLGVTRRTVTDSLGRLAAAS